MGPFAAGQVVVLPFPFSDLGGSKYRPALLISRAGRGDWIACQITSNPYADPLAVALPRGDFDSGGLQRDSFIRPGKLFTANESLFGAVAGLVPAARLAQTRAAIVGMVMANDDRLSA